MHLGGDVQIPPYPALGGVVKELGSNYADDAKKAIIEAEETLHLFLNTHIFDAEKKDDRIVAVVGKKHPDQRGAAVSGPVVHRLYGRTAA